MKLDEKIELNEKIEEFYGKNPELATTFFEALIDDHVDIAAGMMISVMGYFTPREWALLSERIKKVTARLDYFYNENDSFRKAIDDIDEAIEKLEDEEEENEEEES